MKQEEIEDLRMIVDGLEVVANYYEACVNGPALLFKYAKKISDLCEKYETKPKIVCCFCRGNLPCYCKPSDWIRGITISEGIK